VPIKAPLSYHQKGVHHHCRELAGRRRKRSLENMWTPRPEAAATARVKQLSVFFQIGVSAGS